jgi:hypothetical protein
MPAIASVQIILPGTARRMLLAATAALIAVAPAHTTGGFGCSASDADVSFDLDALTTRGMGFPVLTFDGSGEIRNESIAPDLRQIAFETRHLAQYWAEDEELKLFVYREREGELPYGHIQLIVRTKWTDDGGATGRYDLQVLDMTGDTTGDGKALSIQGDVSCVFG